MMLDKTVRSVCTLHKDRCCLTITDVREEMAAHFPHEASGATMHCSSRCEEFVLAGFFNNSQKNIKKSLALEVCHKSKYFGKWNMFLFYKIKKNSNLRKPWKIGLVAHLTIFVEKEVSPPQHHHQKKLM